MKKQSEYFEYFFVSSFFLNSGLQHFLSLFYLFIFIFLFFLFIFFFLSFLGVSGVGVQKSLILWKFDGQFLIEKMSWDIY